MHLSSTPRAAGAIASLLLLSTGLLACGGGGDTSSGGEASSGDTVKVGVIGPISGPAAPLNPPSKQAAELAIEEINDAGGVLGDQVEAVYADSASTPATAQREARRLVNEDVKTIVQGDTSADRDGAIASLKDSGIPYFFTYAAEGGPEDGGEADICYPNIWLTGQVPSNWWQKPFEWLVKSQDYKTWFILGNDYIFHRTAFPKIQEIVEEAGGSVDNIVYVPLGTTDYGTVVSELKALPEDTAILNVLVGDDMTAFLKQWEQAGGTNDRMVTFDVTENQAQALGKTAAGIRGIYDYYQTLETPGNKEYIAALKKKFGGETLLQSSLSNETYEALHLWALAADKAGSFDLDKVSPALTEVTFDGPRGPVSFDENHTIPLSSIIGRLGDEGLYTIEKTFPKVPGGDQCEMSSYEVG